jgi:hypothetical protein
MGSYFDGPILARKNVSDAWHCIAHIGSKEAGTLRRTLGSLLALIQSRRHIYHIFQEFSLEHSLYARVLLLQTSFKSVARTEIYQWKSLPERCPMSSTGMP